MIYGQSEGLFRPDWKYANRLVRYADERTRVRGVADDVVLMKDRRGRVIGFERLNYLSRKQHQAHDELPVEVQLM